MYKNYTLLIFVLVIICSCGEELVVKKSSAKAIVKFSFSQFNPIIEATIDETTKRITTTLPSTADITKLSPTIIVSPGSKVSPVSDKEQDFSKEVAYTVTAEDGTEVTYKVTVRRERSGAKDILAFSFTDFSPIIVAKIDPTTKAITATLPSTADLTKLKPTISISDKAFVTPVSGNVIDFSKPVNFMVTAEDGSSQSYVVTLVKEAPPVQAVTIKSGNNPSTNVVYVIGSSTLYALNASTGKEIWNYDNNGRILFANSTIYDGNIVLVSKGVKFINASTGVLNGEIQETSHSYSSPVIVNNVLYYGTGESGLLKAFDLKTKKEKWATSVVYWADASPTVYKGNVFIAVKNGSCFNAYDAETGVLKWKTNTINGNMSGFINACTFENLVITSGSYSFKAFDINTGAIKWKFEECNGTTSSPTESEGIIYFGDDNSNFYALDATNGSLKWKYKTGAILDSSPIVDQDFVYIYGKDSFVYAFNKKTGELQWKYQIGSPSDYSYAYVESSPVVFEGVLYIIGRGSKTYALNAKTGEKIWEFNKTFYQTFASPFIIDKNGKVYHSGVSGMTN